MLKESRAIHCAAFHPRTINLVEGVLYNRENLLPQPLPSYVIQRHGTASDHCHTLVNRTVAPRVEPHFVRAPLAGLQRNGSSPSPTGVGAAHHCHFRPTPALGSKFPRSCRHTSQHNPSPSIRSSPLSLCVTLRCRHFRVSSSRACKHLLHEVP